MNRLVSGYHPGEAARKAIDRRRTSCSGLLLELHGRKNVLDVNVVKKLHGNWEAEAGEQDGKELPAGEIEKVRVLSKDAQAILCPGGEWTPLDLRLHAERTPRVLYATASKGKDKGKAAAMIYRVEKDTLKLCWDSKEGKMLPKEFATKPGSGMIWFTFKRERPALIAPPVRED
jgi:uncharacterized protein (TIGR03067 family)